MPDAQLRSILAMEFLGGGAWPQKYVSRGGSLSSSLCLLPGQHRMNRLCALPQQSHSDGHVLHTRMDYDQFFLLSVVSVRYFVNGMEVTNAMFIIIKNFP